MLGHHGLCLDMLLQKFKFYLPLFAVVLIMLGDRVIN